MFKFINFIIIQLIVQIIVQKMRTLKIDLEIIISVETKKSYF